AEDGIRDFHVTGVQTCALPILHLRSVGEDEDAAHAAGLKVRRIKLNSVLISGALSGLGGAQLAMGSLSSFGQDMTAGRGFIAVRSEERRVGKECGWRWGGATVR